ncbi:MAG: NAD(P)-dependent oxidoreductase [Burkholderiaceae bacterium]|nr:NAD(P)-dependent oxidoreductase [Burkholderiaceae bacterium]
MSTIGFIGTGAMGAPMATNLIKAGHTLRVFNRTRAKTDALAALGAVVCDTPQAVAEGADFVMSMVADDVAARAVMLGAHGITQVAAPGTIIVDSSTITPAMAREIAAAAAQRKVGYLDAPVSGSVPQATNAELVFMVGGDAGQFERAQPLFEAMGRMSRRMGESGTGATIKLVNNMMSGTVNTALAEALSVSEAAGVDPEGVFEILNEGAAGCRLTRTKIPKIQKRDFSAQFQLELMDKDLRYFLSLAQDVDRQTPVASLVRSQLQAARRASLGKEDVCSIFRYVSGEVFGD